MSDYDRWRTDASELSESEKKEREREQRSSKEKADSDYEKWCAIIKNSPSHQRVLEKARETIMANVPEPPCFAHKNDGVFYQCTCTKCRAATLSENLSPVPVCNSGVDSGSRVGAVNAARCERPADEPSDTLQRIAGEALHYVSRRIAELSARGLRSPAVEDLRDELRAIINDQGVTPQPEVCPHCETWKATLEATERDRKRLELRVDELEDHCDDVEHAAMQANERAAQPPAACRFMTQNSFYCAKGDIHEISDDGTCGVRPSETKKESRDGT